MNSSQLSEPAHPVLVAPPSPARERAVALREAVTFAGLVFAIVVATALALPHAPGVTTPLLAMQTPVFVVGLIVLLGTPRGRRRALLASLGVHRPGLRSWPAAFLLPVLTVLLLPYAAALALGSAALAPLGSASWLGVAALLVTNLALMTGLVMGEEIGWRGYLLPRVQTLLPRRRAALVVGFVQGLFHLPLILLTTTYDSIGSRWVVAPVVVVTLTFAGVFFAWLRDRSRSVWPVALAHASVNTLLDGGGLVVVLAPVTLACTAGESGLATLAAVVGLAVVLLVRGSTWRPDRELR